jgi:MerR family transcriptional regulator, mercuric resistance operon regulatory protein
MSAADTLTPRQVARATGVSPDTLRHYERRGLLPSPQRTSAGYRRYPSATVERVELIQRALFIGFSLDELGEVLAERDRGGVPCRKVLGLVQARLAALEQRLRELADLKTELVALVADWESQLASSAAERPARLLDGLGTRRAVEEGRRRRLRGRLPERS